MTPKRVPILPTLVTLGNAFCGFTAIDYAMGGAGADLHRFYHWIGWSGGMILLAMVFDALDGKVARLAHATSDLGRELDSLCDVISFGVAPAVIVKTLAAYQNYLPRLGWAAERALRHVRGAAAGAVQHRDRSRGGIALVLQGPAESRRGGVHRRPGGQHLRDPRGRPARRTSSPPSPGRCCRSWTACWPPSRSSRWSWRSS